MVSKLKFPMIGVPCTIIKLSSYDLLVVSPTILIKYAITRPPPGLQGSEYWHWHAWWVLCLARPEVSGFSYNGSRMQGDREEVVGFPPVAVGCQYGAVDASRY